MLCYRLLDGRGKNEGERHYIGVTMSRLETFIKTYLAGPNPSQATILRRKRMFFHVLLWFPALTFASILGYTKYSMFQNERQRKQHEQEIQEHEYRKQQAKEKFRKALEDWELQYNYREKNPKRCVVFFGRERPYTIRQLCRAPFLKQPPIHFVSGRFVLVIGYGGLNPSCTFIHACRSVLSSHRCPYPTRISSIANWDEKR